MPPKSLFIPESLSDFSIDLFSRTFDFALSCSKLNQSFGSEYDRQIQVFFKDLEVIMKIRFKVLDKKIFQTSKDVIVANLFRNDIA
jgi:hypothetical protein